jgi:hypothetical protein
MSNVFRYFVEMITLMFFYSFAVTTLIYAMGVPTSAQLSLTSAFSQSAVNITSVQNQIQGNVEGQARIPVIDIAALVFYSGNMILDLMLNFIFAIPSLLTLLVTIFTTIFSIDPFIAVQLKIIIGAILGVSYILALISFILSIRSRSVGMI